MHSAGTWRRQHRWISGCWICQCTEVLELVLHNGRDPKTGELLGLETGDPRDFKNIEELKDALKKQLAYFYRMIKDGYDLMVPYHMLRYPVIFASMAMKGCVESGKSVQEGGAKYSTAGMFITGSANLADSIVAIEDVVYKDHDVTMDQLIEAAMNQNFVPVVDDRGIFIGIVRRQAIIRYCYEKARTEQQAHEQRIPEYAAVH